MDSYLECVATLNLVELNSYFEKDRLDNSNIKNLFTEC
jgi:hypothetical protein